MEEAFITAQDNPSIQKASPQEQAYLQELILKSDVIPSPSDIKATLKGLTLPDYFQCTICQTGAIYQPKECSSCEKAFCQSCIEGLQACPSCAQAPLVAKGLSRIAASCLAKERVLGCPSGLEQCKKQMGSEVTYEQLISHLLGQCPQVQVKCISQNCQTKIPRVQLLNHMLTCPKLRPTCERCKLDKGLINPEAHDCIVALNEKCKQSQDLLKIVQDNAKLTNDSLRAEIHRANMRVMELQQSLRERDMQIENLMQTATPGLQPQALQAPQMVYPVNHIDHRAQPFSQVPTFQGHIREQKDAVGVDLFSKMSQYEEEKEGARVLSPQVNFDPARDKISCYNNLVKIMHKLLIFPRSQLQRSQQGKQKAYSLPRNRFRPQNNPLPASPAARQRPHQKPKKSPKQAASPCGFIKALQSCVQPGQEESAVFKATFSLADCEESVAKD